MATQVKQLHFVLFPFMAQGHMIPLIDIAKLLAHQGMIVTIITTPTNAARFEPVLARAKESGLHIKQLQIQFPCLEAGLPDGCENFDMLPSLNLAMNFFTAANMVQVQEQVEKLFEELTPRPSCIIADLSLPYTYHVASRFHIPRISFNSVGCFCLVSSLNSYIHKGVLDNITSETEYFVLPGLPDRIEFTKVQLPISLDREMREFLDQIMASDLASDGMITLTFEELEAAYVEEYKKARGGKVWCIGPVSLCNKDNIDKAQRGNNTTIDENQCLKWLDLQEPRSVIYTCLGTLCNLIPSQLIELALGLEASNQPFIWVIKGNNSDQLEKWILEDGFEERIKGRGLLIRGWAPQLLILSHPAIGGFLTHCGWNSTLEGVAAGVPFITWPLFGDQFCNEKLIVQVLKIGISIGVEYPVKWGKEEEIGVLVKKEDIKHAVDKLMDEGEEGKGRRERVRELAKIAKGSFEEGGSSYLNIKLLIQDIMQETPSRNSN